MTANPTTSKSATTDWKTTTCILCECNCGIEVQLGGEDGRRFVRVRGDKAHPGSRGYACEKPSRLDYYQNGPDRLTRPLRRRADGEFEEIDWDTAIREVAARLSAVRDEHGGEKIIYYGGGGQGNHLPGAYSRGTLATLGVKYRSNALAQEKTGEFYVNAKMFGAGVIRADFEHCEVALFVGKNPWQSHGFPHARITLKAIAKDPNRSMIVIDPRKSETAEMADFHLQVRPGTDAWLITALLGVIMQEDLANHAWLADHATGFDEIAPLFRAIDVAEYCEISGVDEAQVRAVARRIARAESVAVFEDLGVQMNLNSTLVSYLEKLVWALTGHFGRPGTQYVPTALQALASGSGSDRTSPVAGAKIIGGLVPCNVIAEEILTDHPNRYRAMIVESGNPAHSLADSQRMRRALQSLDTLVVIDVALTETARLADYVLPTPTQFEKCEATFFNFEFPKNVFQLRQPLLDAPDGVLTEAEIHSRLAEALGVVRQDDVAKLREAAEQGLSKFATAFFQKMAEDPAFFAVAPVVLFRALGPSLPPGLAEAAVLWGAAQMCVQRHGDSVRRAGFDGDGLELGNSLFQGILGSPSGVVFTADEFDESFRRIGLPEGRISLAVPEMFSALEGLASVPRPASDPEFPFVLSAGERRSFTANTIMRDPSWRRKDREGALRLSPEDAEALGVSDGDRVRLTTRRGNAELPIEVSKRMQRGHISIPNGMGLDARAESGERVRTGVAPNELTASGDRDPFAGTPTHKHVAANVEALLSGNEPVALVVGAGDYVGAAISRRFAREGYTVCMGRRGGEKLLPLAEEIRAEGGEAHPFSLDARQEDQVVERFAQIENEIGPLEVVVFNVGANVNFPVRETTSRVFTKVWQMACLGGFLTGREAARYMAPRKKGSILFTGATASVRGGTGYTAFASAKFGLRALAQSMARELGPDNIHVAHMIIDAPVDTAWVREMIAKRLGDDVEPPDGALVDPASIADAYWFVHQQSRDAWTFEFDLRPSVEKW